MNEILPEIYREQGITKGYDLWKMPFFIIEELKSQQARIDGQKEAIARQEEELAWQDAEIDALVVAYCKGRLAEGICAG